MKRDLELPLIDRANIGRARSIFAALAVVVVGIVAIFWETATGIVAIWIRSETFAHCFAVVPISLWLAWVRRDAIAAAPARPWWPGVALVALAGATWLVAETANVLVVKQFAFALMIIAAIVTVVGTAVARAAAFPLVFLLFAIPAGEALVPVLIDRTADFTVAALRASGIPVYREGNRFVIPSGIWSVVEACSGIRYLIASMMVGTIFSMLTYRSAGRRIAFFVASIVVPIVANWMRAYLIVMLGHLSGNRIAVGVDHLIYGWVFFGVVMLLLFWVGSLWREEPAPADDSRMGPVASIRPSWTATGRSRWLAVAAAVLAVAYVWRPLDAAVNGSPDLRVPALAALPGDHGWADGARTNGWKPDFSGASAELLQSFENGKRIVTVYVGYYRNQIKGRELVTSTNVIVKPESADWKQLASVIAPIEWNGSEADADWRSVAGHDVKLQALKLYWIAGRLTSNDYVAKALLALSKLTGAGDDSALIVIYTTYDEAGEASARATLRAFAASMSPVIERALDAVRAGRS